MKLLINEAPLLVLPSLALQIGLDEAILLQQLHFRLNHQGVERDKTVWYCQSHARWAKQLPFWSEQKIKRMFLKLEKLGIVQSTDKFNQFYVDRTKWYKLDYTVLQTLLDVHISQKQPAIDHEETLPTFTAEPSDRFHGEPSKRKELKDVIKDVTLAHQIDAVLVYLNEKANKRFNPKTNANRKMIAARLKEGYSSEDCYLVIDEQVANWLHDEHMRQYLRPMTLFRPANFESYLSNAQTKNERVYQEPQAVVLDFEEDS